MTTQLHLAAQYLAAAGKSFLEKKDDDSHTNLGFSIEEESMFTRPLNKEGAILSLGYQDFTLDWSSNNLKTSLLLDGSTHSDIIKWIANNAIKANIEKPYNYNLHYELPYPAITNDFTFKLTDAARLSELKKNRITAQQALDVFLKKEQLYTEVRTWPHHFDTGALTALENETGLAIGLGLAIPDTMINDYYFYMSAYKGHDGLDTSNLNALTNGKWYNDGFKGAVLPITGMDETEILTFFEEALKAYKN